MKSPELEKILNDLSKEFFGNERSNDYCVICLSTDVKREDFRDELSWKEFGISKMCQKCQDISFQKE
jgi:hypothetical protein